MKRFPVVTWYVRMLDPQWTLVPATRMDELVQGIALYLVQTRG